MRKFEEVSQVLWIVTTGNVPVSRITLFRMRPIDHCTICTYSRDPATPVFRKATYLLNYLLCTAHKNFTHAAVEDYCYIVIRLKLHLDKQRMLSRGAW
jgi:hypothetical protein